MFDEIEIDEILLCSLVYQNVTGAFGELRLSSSDSSLKKTTKGLCFFALVVVSAMEVLLLRSRHLSHQLVIVERILLRHGLHFC